MDRRCHPQFMILKKTQWDRLKKKAGLLKCEEETAAFNDKREYYKQLDEQSKAWQKNWPDTVEGCLAKVQARKERQKEREQAFVKTFEKLQKNKVSRHAEAVAEAKHKIFYTSCYGQQLISAVRESKAIEERKAQIEFNKLLKAKEVEYDEMITKQIASIENNLYNFAKKDEEAIKKKQSNKEHAELNKMMHEYKKYEIAKAKEEERLGELEDARLQKLNLEFEKHEMDHCREKFAKQMKEYEADSKAVREDKRRRNQEDDELVRVWAKHNQRVRCLEKLTWKKIIEAKDENHKKVYEMVDKALQDENKAYEAFVEKGIEQLENRQNVEENPKEPDKDHHKQVFEDYLRAVEIKDILKHRNKCCCDRQSLFTKSCGPKNSIAVEDGDTYKPESFLAPAIKLSAELERRRKEKTSWTALSGEHRYFAQQAAIAISECKYKHMAKKVAEGYKKAYCLDSTSLPIPEC